MALGIGRAPEALFCPDATQPVHATTMPQKENKESALKPLFINVG